MQIPDRYLPRFGEIIAYHNGIAQKARRKENLPQPVKILLLEEKI
jgi:hypothetical protein